MDQSPIGGRVSDQLMIAMQEELDVKRAELNEAEASIAPLKVEVERLERAMSVLSGTGARGTTRAAAKRAPRGANRQAILDAVKSHPGSTASEIAERSGVSRPVTYPTLSKLVEDGVVKKDDKAYSLA